MKVKDIMTRNTTTLSSDMSAMEAAKKLSELKISGLPVVDSDGRLVGMFTEKDILKAILPSYVEKVGKFIYEENPKGTKKKLEGLSGISVGDLMRKEVITITEETDCYEAARVMLTQKARRVPVIDRENKVIGIVARCDVLKAFMGGM